MSLAYLGAENINRLIGGRLSEQTASRILRQFTRETYTLYRVPQDLEFLLQTVRDYPETAVPQTKSQLYDRVLAPVFSSWSDSGRPDYPDLLAQRSYMMMVTREQLLDNKEEGLPEDFIHPLLARRLLVERDTRHYFQHNLLRDYLASRYFSQRWDELLDDKSTLVDSNWVEMLKFAVGGELKPAECERLLYELLSRNERVTQRTSHGSNRIIRIFPKCGRLSSR